MDNEKENKEPESCGECFCNDLCMFILRKGRKILTTCEDFRTRVRRVVDREIEKSSNLD